MNGDPRATCGTSGVEHLLEKTSMHEYSIVFSNNYNCIIIIVFVLWGIKETDATIYGQRFFVLNLLKIQNSRGPVDRFFSSVCISIHCDYYYI